MKNLIKVSALTLVALTLLVGSVSSAAAGSRAQINKNVLTSSKQSSSLSFNVKRAPNGQGLSGNDLKCVLKYLDCLDGPLTQGVCQMLQTLCKADLGNLNSNSQLAPKSPTKLRPPSKFSQRGTLTKIAPTRTPAKRAKFRYMGRQNFMMKTR